MRVKPCVIVESNNSSCSIAQLEPNCHKTSHVFEKIITSSDEQSGTIKTAVITKVTVAHKTVQKKATDVDKKIDDDNDY